MATCPEVTIQTILGSECIGDSLPKINGNFSALQTAVCDLVSGSSSGTVTNVTGTTPIIITGTPTTTPNVTLDAAFIARLTTLENNMNNIGNYPYLECAKVCTPATLPETIPQDVPTTLQMDTVVNNTGNFGSLSNYQITLAAGTYQYSAFSPIWVTSNASTYGKGIFSLNVVSPTPRYISRKEYHSGNQQEMPYFEGQFKCDVSTTVELQFLGATIAYVSPDDAAGVTGNVNFGASATLAGGSQRTTIKLWKVG